MGRLALADTLRIEVSDAREPEPRPPAPDSEAGRGLLLVEALAGLGHEDRVVGKTVWAELAVP
ncbi:hypothetical protein [Streptomyces sp. NPDC001820]|uniref:hypothetical protein n=1 Tax=Streptomyces sp. NPDC001820 TaxID=3364613 RepID=UPI0036BC1AF5